MEREPRSLSDSSLLPEERRVSLVRHNSVEEEKASNAILEAIEAGDHAEVRSIISSRQTRRGLSEIELDESFLSQSMRMEHKLRTPLMAAAATGDLGLFKTVLGAVNRAIERPGADTRNKRLDQLTMTDSNERTLAMHAVRGGNVAILEIVLNSIDESKWELLLDKDYVGKTVLMHAASSGRAAVFKKLFSVMKKKIDRKRFIAHILRTSDDGRTIFMHAARCGNHRSLSAVALACKKNIKPSQMRELLEEVDGEEMTFLMHAVTGCCEGTADEAESEMKKKQKEREKKHRQKEKKNNQLDVGKVNFTTFTTVEPTAGAPESKGEESKEGNELEEGQSVTSGSGAASAANATPLENEAEREIPSATTSSEPHGGQDNQQAASSSTSKFKVLEKELLVFRVAWLLVKEVLWKEQVRDQLKAKDCWGRTILTHAVISGRLQVFDVAFDIIRENILDYEIEDLTGINKDDNEVTVMEASLDRASKDMVNLVNRRDQELKKSVAIREKASTIEAKIQSFIPGKSIVIFQLLLPEMKNADAALILLIVMSALAPIFAYSGNLITKETPSTRKNPTLSLASILLAAPAMWWWGIGTSSIAEDSFGWSATSSAASLAVATIVIPAIDQFFGSHKIERLYDWFSLRKRRFTRQSELDWEKMQKEDVENPEDDVQAELQGRGNSRHNYVALWPTSHDATEAGTEGDPMV